MAPLLFIEEKPSIELSEEVKTRAPYRFFNDPESILLADTDGHAF
jgi:hypothetical protein